MVLTVTCFTVAVLLRANSHCRIDNYYYGLASNLTDNTTNFNVTASCFDVTVKSMNKHSYHQLLPSKPQTRGLVVCCG